MASSETRDSANAAPAPAPAPPPAPAPRPEIVPEELLNKLHEANEHFSAARHHREAAVDSSTPEEYEHDKAAQELRDAEKQVEEVTEEIDRDLHPPQ